MAQLVRLIEDRELDLVPRGSAFLALAGDTLGPAVTPRDGFDVALGEWATHFADADQQQGLEQNELAAVATGAGAFTPEELHADAAELGVAADEGRGITADFDAVLGSSTQPPETPPPEAVAHKTVERARHIPFPHTILTHGPPEEEAPPPGTLLPGTIALPPGVQPPPGFEQP